MTTVVAAADDEGRIHLAADTLTNVYDRPIVGGARKLTRFPFGEGTSGDAVIGCSGDGAIAQALIAHLRITAPPTDPSSAEIAAWAHHIAARATEIAVDGKLTDPDGRLDGLLLLAAAGRLWTVMHGQAVYHPDGRAAIGAGEGPAIGALDALLDMGLHPGDAVVRACAIGIHRDKHSAGPMQAETVDPFGAPIG